MDIHPKGISNTEHVMQNKKGDLRSFVLMARKHTHYMHPITAGTKTV